MNKNVKNNELLCAYAVVGDDLLKRQRVLKRMHMRLEREGDLSFNYDKFDAADTSAQDIISACTTLPFASEKRLVVCENFSKFKKSDAEQIAKYIKNPLSTTVLILISDQASPSSPILKAISTLSREALIDCAQPNKKKLPEFVVSMAKNHGLSMTIGAASTLIELVGENTVHIDEELRKIALSKNVSNKSEVVEEKDVRDLVARTAELKPWDFVDAFSKRDLKQCMKVRSCMPSVTSHALLRQCIVRIRELICVKTLGNSTSKENIADELGLTNRAFIVGYRAAQAQNFTAKELRCALISSVETEKKMKSGANPDIAFEEWLLSVLARPSIR